MFEDLFDDFMLPLIGILGAALSKAKECGVNLLRHYIEERDPGFVELPLEALNLPVIKRRARHA